MLFKEKSEKEKIAVTTWKLLKDKQNWEWQSNPGEDQTKTKLKANEENN